MQNQKKIINKTKKKKKALLAVPKRTLFVEIQFQAEKR